MNQHRVPRLPQPTRPREPSWAGYVNYDSATVIGLGEFNGVLRFFFEADDGIRDLIVTGVQTCALPIFRALVPHLHRRMVLEPLHGDPDLELRHRADTRRRLELLLEVRRLLGQEMTPQHHVLAGLRDRKSVV